MFDTVAWFPVILISALVLVTIVDIAISAIADRRPPGPPKR